MCMLSLEPVIYKHTLAPPRPFVIIKKPLDMNKRLPLHLSGIDVSDYCCCRSLSEFWISLVHFSNIKVLQSTL
jgi:hypothetical protein